MSGAARIGGGLCLANVGALLGFATFPALLPHFREIWALSNTEAGWVAGSFFAGYMVAVPLLVSLTDRMPARRIFAASALIAALAHLGFAFFADGLWTALLFRTLAGVGFAGCYMPGMRALSDHVSGPGLSRAVGFYMGSFPFGNGLSMFVAGEVFALAGWEAAFAVAALGSLAAIGAVLVALPARPARAERPETALLDFRPILRDRRLMAYVIAYAAHSWEVYGGRSWLVAFFAFSLALHPDASLAWKATTFAALSGVIALPGNIIGGELTSRIPRRQVIVWTMLASVVVSGTFGFTAALPFWIVLACAALNSISISIDAPAIQTGVVGSAPPQLRGAAMATQSALGFFAAFLAPLVFGMVLDLFGATTVLAWGLAYGTLALAAAIGPLAMLFAARDPAPARRAQPAE